MSCLQAGSYIQLISKVYTDFFLNISESPVVVNVKLFSKTYLKQTVRYTLLLNAYVVVASSFHNVF